MNCLEVALFFCIFIQNKNLVKHQSWQSPTQNYNVCDSGLRRAVTKTPPSHKSSICIDLALSSRIHLNFKGYKPL